MVETNFTRPAGRGVAEFAGADQSSDAVVGDHADAVVVPVEDVEPAVGTVGQVLRQVEVRLPRRRFFRAFARVAGAGKGFDASVGVARGRGRFPAGEQGEGDEQERGVDHGKTTRRMR